MIMEHGPTEILCMSTGKKVIVTREWWLGFLKKIDLTSQKVLVPSQPREVRTGTHA